MRTLRFDNFANCVTRKFTFKAMFAGTWETEKRNDPDSVIYQAQ